MPFSSRYLNLTFRIVFYLFGFLVFIPFFVALRINHISPGRERITADNPRNPFPFPAKTISTRTVDNITIRGWHASANNKKIVVIIPGFGLTHKEMAIRWKGIYPGIADIFLVDLRNHGLSDSGITTFGFHEALDVQAAVNRLKPNYEEIILWGMSMGAASAVRTALSGNPVDMLILEGVYDDLSNAICLQAKNNYIPKFPFVKIGLVFYEYLSGVNLAQMDMCAGLRKLKDTPILIVHSRKDQEVPMTSFRCLEKALGPKGQTLLFNQGGHEAIYEQNSQMYQKRLIKFIQRG
jgi:pimeloyl-ACP methyl ester carboxylesterase